jgi:transcription elongation factor Elf1
MNCVCDNCKQEIQIEAKDIKFKAIDELMVNVTYFECIHCDKKYIVSCIDKYILKEQRRYFKLVRENGKHDATIKALKNMKIHSDRLKDKVVNLL